MNFGGKGLQEPCVYTTTTLCRQGGGGTRSVQRGYYDLEKTHIGGRGYVDGVFGSSVWRFVFAVTPVVSFLFLLTDCSSS